MDADRTVVDANCEFQGKLTGRDARILGRFRGDIELTGRLSTGEGSRVEARIKADSAEIAGEVVGEISVRSLTLSEKARVEGTVQADVISVREGAWLQGAINSGGVHARQSELRPALSAGPRPPLKTAAS